MTLACCVVLLISWVFSVRCVPIETLAPGPEKTPDLRTCSYEDVRAVLVAELTLISLPATNRVSRSETTVVPLMLMSSPALILTRSPLTKVSIEFLLSASKRCVIVFDPVTLRCLYCDP